MSSEPIPEISNPELTTDSRYGGDVMINIRSLLTDIDLSPLFDGWRPKFRTQLLFRSGTIAMLDTDSSNEVHIVVDDIDNVDGNVNLHIPAFIDTDDTMLLQNHPQTINYKVLGTSITVADDIDFNGNAIIDAAISGADNTLTNIPSSALIQITDHTKLPDDVVYDDDSRLTDDRDPNPHASTHAEGGTDELKLDDLGIPDDNTDLDVSTSRHGLVPKAPNVTGQFLRSDGLWAILPYATTTARGAVTFADPGESAATLAVEATDPRLSDDRDPNAHHTSHENGGADEISIDWSQITSGKPTTFAPSAHHTSHENGGTDELLIDWSQLASIPSTFTPSAHTHDADEINVGAASDGQVLTIVSGVSAWADATGGGGGGATTLDDLTDVTLTTPTDLDILVYDTSGFINVALSTIDIDWSQLTSVPSTFTPSTHTHSWADITSGTPPKIDDLTVGDDNTDLNATDTYHGLLPKLSGDANQYLSGAGTWSTPAGGSGGGSTSLAGLTDDVLITSPANNQLIKYDTASSKWKNVAQSTLSIAWGQLTSVPSTFAPSGHHTSHENGGTDEIAIDWSQITTGVPTTFTPAGHHLSHENGGADELALDWSQITTGVPTVFTPDDHALSHESGGSDELDITTLGGFSGVSTEVLKGDGTWAAESGGGASTLDDLTDVVITTAANNQLLKYNSTSSKWENVAQSTLSIAWGQLTSVPSSFTPSSHHTSHENGGSDEISIDWSQITSGTPSTFTPSTHATSHKSGGGDAIKLDELAASTDVTTLNATTSAHGLFPKLSTTAFQVYRINSGGSGGEWATLDNERVGVSVADGGSTTYNITHGLGTGSAPTYYFVDCVSHSTPRTVSVTSTTITVTFTGTLSGSTNAVKIMWRVIA